MKHEVTELRLALIHELLSTYGNPRAEGALLEFVAAMQSYSGAPTMGGVVETLGRKKPGDPDLVRQVLRDAERTPSEMIDAARKLDGRIKPNSFRATVNRMFKGNELARRKSGDGRGYLYRLKDRSG